MAAMPGNREALIAAFDSRELDPLIALLDERVVWRGLPDNDQHEHEEPEEDHDHGPPMCTDRDQVREVLEGFLASGSTPVVLAEVGDTLVVDPSRSRTCRTRCTNADLGV